MPNGAKKPRLDQSETKLSLVPGEIINPPYSMWRCTDHTTKNDYVCVTVNVFTSCKSTSFDITEDGLKIIIRFSWSNAMFTPWKMFNEAIRDKTMSLEHPMLYAMANEFLDSGITDNSNNEGQWIILLPCQVRREVSSYTMAKLTYETTQMVFVKMTVYQNDVIIEQANRTITFE